MPNLKHSHQHSYFNISVNIQLKIKNKTHALVLIFFPTILTLESTIASPSDAFSSPENEIGNNHHTLYLSFSLSLPLCISLSLSLSLSLSAHQNFLSLLTGTLRGFLFLSLFSNKEIDLTCAKKEIVDSGMMPFSLSLSLFPKIFWVLTAIVEASKKLSYQEIASPFHLIFFSISHSLCIFCHSCIFTSLVFFQMEWLTVTMNIPC